MRILEARDGFIKIESNEKIALSSFLEINDKGQKYIAQTIQSRKFNEAFIAFAKLLFIYDGSLNSYDNSLPSLDATIQAFPFSIINQSFKDSEEPIALGTFTNSEDRVLLDKNCFSRKMLMSIDTPAKINNTVTNLAESFINHQNVLVIDMLGVIDASVKYKAASDIYLPLNNETLQFMYEDCLNDATSDSKSMVKEIFQDLAPTHQ